MRPFDVIHNALSDEYGTAVEQTRAIMDALSANGIGLVELPTPPWVNFVDDSPPVQSKRLY